MKKGSITGEIWLFVVELLLIGFCFISLMNFVFTLQKNTLYEKNYLSRDISLIINALYASPGIAKYEYKAGNVKLNEFKFMLEEGKIGVADIIEGRPGISTRYGFGYDKQSPPQISEIMGLYEFQIMKDVDKTYLTADKNFNQKKIYCSAPIKSLKINKIFIDPGHGFGDFGFVYNDKKESEIVQKYSKRLNEDLKNAGYKTDFFKPTLDRYSQVKNINDMIISIHLGKYSSRNVIKAYAPSNAEYNISSFACNLLNSLDSPKYTSIALLRPDASKFDKRSDYIVLINKNTILIELGNIESEELLTEKEFSDAIIKLLAEYKR
jgi:N-acetylmuramoyl-L-alanine amidase